MHFQHPHLVQAPAVVGALNVHIFPRSARDRHHCIFFTCRATSSAAGLCAWPGIQGPRGRLMSVAAHSPACHGHKRLFEQQDATADLVSTHKRLRKLSTSPHGRRDSSTESSPVHAGSSSLTAALCGLFPGMDEQVSSGTCRSLANNFNRPCCTHSVSAGVNKEDLRITRA